MTLLAFLAFVTLASGYMSIAFTLRTNGIRWVNCNSNIPQPLRSIKLPITLPSTLWCGHLDVPMDYSEPFSTDNKITLGFSMYRPNNPRGLVNFNPGGPGAEVASFAWQMALNLTEATLFVGLESFDFLAMDVRGSYSSNPLNCSTDDLPIPSSLPANEAEFKSSHAMASTYAQSCIDISTPKGIIAHVGTADTVEDWNSLREALGYEKLHFLAYSYGTIGASLYARKFPQNVGRFVLDSILPRGLTNLELVTYKIKAVNRLLLRTDAYCIYDPACPFHTQGKGSVVNAFHTVLDRADSGNFSNTTAYDVRVMVTSVYLSGSPNFSALNLALYAALHGNWSAFSYASFSSVNVKLSPPVLPFICLDMHIDNNTFAGFNNIRQYIAKYDPAHFDYTQELGLIPLCGGWPYHGNFNQKLSTSTPMLLVTSDFDLNTPIELATFEWNQAQNSILIVRHGDDHGTFYVPGPARMAEIDFLNTGVLPKARNQTLVTIYTSRSEEVPIAEPYTAPIGPLAGDSAKI